MTLNTAVSNPQATTNLIIVMGVSGSGKTTLASNLADLYGYEFLDGDDFHSAEARHLMAQGTPLTDEHRAPWVAAIKAHLQVNASQRKHAVLAFSGLKRKHRDILRSAGLRTLVIHLTSDITTIAARINLRKGHFMSPALLASQFDALEVPEDETDVANLDVGGNIEEVVARASLLVDRILFNKHTPAQAPLMVDSSASNPSLT
jgi:gluconokinase